MFNLEIKFNTTWHHCFFFLDIILASKRFILFFHFQIYLGKIIITVILYFLQFFFFADIQFLCEDY